MTEQFCNAAQTALNGAITYTATSLTVASAAMFPTTGTFRLIIDTEILLVTAVAGAVFTVTRGAEGTTPAPHANNALVTAIITAGALAQLKADAGGTPPRRSSALTTTLVPGTDYHLSMTASGQTANLPLLPPNGTPFRIKAAFSTVGGTVILQPGAGDTIEGATNFTLGPLESATVTYNLDTLNWEDC